MNLSEFQALLDSHGCKPVGNAARCPAHDDSRASLSISQGDDGRILLHCHAGCTPDAIVGAMGMTMADLFNGKPKNVPNRIVAAYDYTDEAGKLLFQVVRFDPKGFKQRRKDPSSMDGWNWSTKGVRRVPFHLPQLLAAVKDGRPVFIVEGEKDVLTLENAGFAATCNPGGAGKWQSEYGKYFKGAAVIVIADKDKPGRDHAADVAAKLQGTAATVKVIELPDVDGKPVKDASDWFAAGGDAFTLDDLAQSAPDVTATDHPWMALVEDGAEMAVEQLPELVQVVEGIVGERSKLAIVSSAKSFKTWLTIYLALSISHGLTFLRFPASRRRVIYFNLELKGETFKRRLQAIAKALSIEVESGWFKHVALRGQMAGLSVHEMVSRMIALAKHYKSSVVVIDPVFKLNTEGEENSSKDQTVFFNELDRITTEGGCTVILNDHTTKGNQSEKDPLDVIRGSSAKGGDLDAAMVIRKHEVEGAFRVDMVHRELPPVDPFCMSWEFPLMRLRPDLSPDAMKKAKGGRKKTHDPQELCAAIIESTVEEPVSVSAWAKAAGITRQTLQGYLPGLRAKGWIATTGEGSNARQYLTEKGKYAAQQWVGGDDK